MAVGPVNQINIVHRYKRRGEKKSLHNSKINRQWDQTEHTLRCLIKLTVSTVWDFTGEQILWKSCLLHFIQNKRDNLNYTLKANILYFCEEYKFCTTSSIVS